MTLLTPYLERLRKAQTTLRQPTAEDGYALNQLIASCPPLDTNSVYCNLLQSGHFSNTAVLAHQQDKLVGSTTGYILPQQTDTLFIWQVAVSDDARGLGLATAMLLFILNEKACESVSYLETTITRDNEASWALFERLAEKLNADVTRSVYFEKAKHFYDQHDTEMLVRIGPF